MPSISLTDSTSASFDATLLDTALLGTTPHSVLAFLHDKVLGMMEKPLDQVQLESQSLVFNYTPKISLAGGSGTFTGGAGAGGKVDLLKPAPTLFAKDQFGTEIPMNGNFYLALAFDLSASASLGGTVCACALNVTDAAKGTATLHVPFSRTAGAFPTLKASLATLLSAYRLPTHVDDLKAWPPGSLFSFDCAGSVGFKGSINMLAAVNPTASLGFSQTAGPISVTAGPAVTVCGSFTLSGEFLVRLWKRDDNTVQLGYYKKTGGALTVAFDGALGADATVGSFDLVAQLYTLLGDKAKLDPAWIKANIPASQADHVRDIFKVAVAKKLSLEVNAEADATFAESAAFAWNFDLRTAAGPAQQALNAAFKGQIDPLLAGGTLPAGVTAAGSVLDRIRETKRTFTFNFLGLFDHASVSDAALDLQTRTTDTGQLILTDTAHVKLLTTDTTVVSTDKLRQVLDEEGAATVTYAATVGKIVPQLTVMYSFFNYQASAKTDDLQGFLAIARAVTGKDLSAPWTTFLHAGTRSQTAYLEVALKYDVNTASALFLNAGTLRDPKDYTAAIRHAILLMPPEPALNPAFLAAVHDDKRWAALLNVGDVPDMYPLLGVDRQDPPQWAVAATAWIRQALLWKDPMHAAGQAMQSVSSYLGGHPGADLRHDTAFAQLRLNFANRLRNALQQAPVFPDEASGLLIMCSAAPPAGVALTLNYAGKTVSYP